ncbi:MAG: hypothetical protein KKD05_01705 [Candidatus Omnitrophica bacterium]|nr:hypothetical protein [Candidatus Omnitrophota bacterium]
MPIVGNLQYYKDVAVTHNGTIKQGGVTLVNNNHAGNIVLIGTDANPIEIIGPAVVSGDVLINRTGKYLFWGISNYQSLWSRPHG